MQDSQQYSRVEILEAQLFNGEHPSLGINFRINGVVVQKGITPHDLWIAINEYYERHVTQIQWPQNGVDNSDPLNFPKEEFLSSNSIRFE